MLGRPVGTNVRALARLCGRARLGLPGPGARFGGAGFGERCVRARGARAHATRTAGASRSLAIGERLSAVGRCGLWACAGCCCAAAVCALRGVGEPPGAAGCVAVCEGGLTVTAVDERALGRAV